MELGGGKDEAIAAVLHDAVEDGGGPMMLGRIKTHFGERVALMVSENSDTDQEPKPSWRQRKREYVAGIPKKQPGSVLVSFADKLHNARAIRSDLIAIGPGLWQRFNAQPQETVGYYAALRRAFENSDASLSYDGPACKAAAIEFRELVDKIAEHVGVDPEGAASDLLSADE